MPLILKEHDLQVHVFDVLRFNEKADPRLKWIYAVPNGNYRSWKIGAELKLEGVKKGVSDICVPFPGVVNGVSYPGAYIEMKSESGTVTSEQKEFLEFVSSQGYAVLVAWHYDPALDFMEEYCGLKFMGRDRRPRKL